MRKYQREANEIASNLRVANRSFTASMEWKTLAERVLAAYGWKCMCCGSIPRKRSRVNVDHIKPRRTHPELALEFDNLQVLCSRCNKRKGNKHCTDYRPRIAVQNNT